MAKSLDNISQVTRGCYVVMFYTLGQSIKVVSSLEEVLQVSRKNNFIKTKLALFNLKNGDFLERTESHNPHVHPHKLFVGFKPSTVVAKEGSSVSVITLTVGSPRMVYIRERKITGVAANNGVVSAITLSDGNTYVRNSSGQWSYSYVSSFGFKCTDIIVDNLVVG